MVLKLKVWLLKKLLSDVAKNGVEGDTKLAHINKFEDKLLIVNEKGTTLDEKNGNSVSNLYENRFIGDELYYFEME